MKKSAALSLFALCTFGSATASAGTCAAPTPIPALNGNPNVFLNGSTCGGEAGINMGGTVYNHPSQVYSFTALNVSGLLTISGTGREMSITTSCMSAPIASGAPGLAISVGGLLTVGTQYLLIVSTDPSIPQTNPPVCGEYGVTAPFPVSLQRFSVH